MIRFDISQVPEFERWLNSKLEKAVRRGFVSAAARTVSHIQTVLIPRDKHPPVDRGIFKASWRWSGSIYASGPPVVEILNASPHGPIIDGGVRAENVKVGRKMIDALTAWAKRKGLAGGKPKVGASTGQKPERAEPVPSTNPRDYTAFPELDAMVRKLKRMIKMLRAIGATKGANGESKIPAVSDSEARSLAWAIAMSMKKKGIFNEGKGLQIVARARKVLAEKFIREEVVREIQREFR